MENNSSKEFNKGSVINDQDMQIRDERAELIWDTLAVESGAEAYDSGSHPKLALFDD